MIQPIIRYPGMEYLEEYKRLTHDMYSGINTVIFGTYYQLNNDETTFDPNYQQTYRKQGDLSGRKFNKIHNVPMMQVKEVGPVNLNSAESGVNYMTEAQTTIVIDPIIGLEPHIGDYLMFNISGDLEGWEVANISKSGTFNHTYHQCEIKPYRFRPEFEDVNIFEEFIFIEYPKQIYSLDDGENYAKALNRLTKVITFLNREDNYNDNLGYHVAREVNCFPQLETLLATHKKIAPPTKIYLGENYETEVSTGSVVMLWCMTGAFESDATYMDRVTATSKATRINERLSIWNKYNELLLDSSGSFALSSYFYDDATDFDAATAYMKDCLSKGAYTQYSDSNNSSIGKLADEIMKFYYEGIEIYSEEMLCTNLFEAVVEYCQILKEMAQVIKRSVVLM